ncbi:ATP-binding cassette domain-containing protein [Leptolyngbya sp. FACHB-261]|nr:ATP-binding cassette domain-containing protein [Leptolyngbya sp. FACHB-261]
MADSVKSLGRKLFRTYDQQQISLTSEEFWALKDISFEIKQGDKVGIVGRNGAGKSTLLKILSRITDPTLGRIVIRGKVASLLEVGTGFHPELTGRENIYLNGAILGMSKVEISRKFDEIVDFAEVEKFLDTPVKYYSSGMYVRLAFAVAAHLEPEILIVDEVLAVGDVAFQKKCMGKMSDVSEKQGKTILFVSHNMTAIKSLCERAICMSRGTLVDEGEASSIVAKYIQSYSSNELERVWEDPKTAPGNEQVRLYHVRLSTTQDIPKERMTVCDSLKLEFKYWNFVAGSYLNLSLVLYTLEDICVFNSISESKFSPAGLICETCYIPSNFLNNSTYRARLLIVKDASVPLLDQEELFTFEIHDAERKGGWYGNWIGVIRPDLKWNTELVEPITGSQS